MAKPRFAPVLVLLLLPAQALAHGHRAEAAGFYAKLWASDLDGPGLSFSVPLCWLKIGGHCEHNEFSFVFAGSHLEGEHEGPGGEKLDARLRIYLAGLRYTLPVKKVTPFVHVLGGWVRTRETGGSSGSVERFGSWGSGGAVTATGGLEVEIGRYVRLRGQYGGALFQIGDDTRTGHGFAFAVAIGTHPQGHTH